MFTYIRNNHIWYIRATYIYIYMCTEMLLAITAPRREDLRDAERVARSHRSDLAALALTNGKLRILSPMVPKYHHANQHYGILLGNCWLSHCEPAAG